MIRDASIYLVIPLAALAECEREHDMLLRRPAQQSRAIADPAGTQKRIEVSRTVPPFPKNISLRRAFAVARFLLLR